MFHGHSRIFEPLHRGVDIRDGSQGTSFHIRECKYQLYPWVKPKEWLDFELIWHLASLPELLPTHSLSQKQSLLFISAVGRALCWSENCLGWHKGPDSWTSSTPPPTLLTWEHWQNLKLLLFLVPIHMTPACHPLELPWRLWTPAACTWAGTQWQTLGLSQDFGNSFSSLYNL